VPDLSATETQKLLRTIVRATANLDGKIRKIVREETADIRNDLRKIVREETVDIRDDVKIIKEVQGQQGITLRTMQSDLGGLKNSFRAQTREMHKLGVLFEDLDHRFQAAAELD
jgi:hypothetical protein